LPGNIPSKIEDDPSQPDWFKYAHFSQCCSPTIAVVCHMKNYADDKCASGADPRYLCYTTICVYLWQPLRIDTQDSRQFLEKGIILSLYILI